jgi:limonene-1,2-epoxide hydrolase
MSNAETEVLAFFKEWEPSLQAMLDAMNTRFTDETVWENVGMSRTVGAAEAVGFMEKFADQTAIATGDVEVHHVSSAGNVVLTERTDNFYAADGTKLIAIRLMGVFEMNGPKIVAWRDYFDTASLAAA